MAAILLAAAAVAFGAQSLVREAAGIGARRDDYAQTAVITSLRSDLRSAARSALGIFGIGTRPEEAGA